MAVLTWGELKEEVIALGYGDEYDRREYAGMLVHAANMALMELAQQVPMVGTLSIAHYPGENLFKCDGVIQHGQDEIFEISCTGARGFAFYCDGQGQAVVRQEIGEEGLTQTLRLQEGNGLVLYQGEFPSVGDKLSITFSGDAYTIRGLGAYVRPQGPCEQDVKYDLGALAKENGQAGFLTLVTQQPALLWQGNAGEQARPAVGWRTLGGRMLLLRRDMPGLYSVLNKKLPRRITSATADGQQIDVHQSAQHLPALMMASRIWKEDDAQKAAMYYNEYRIALSLLPHAPDYAVEGWLSANGWL